MPCLIDSRGTITPVSCIVVHVVGMRPSQMQVVRGRISSMLSLCVRESDRACWRVIRC